MKRVCLFVFSTFFTLTVTAQEKKLLVPYSVAFYNLENLFDTIHANGIYDLEFSPAGAKKWDSQKYYQKLSNMADVW